MCAVLFGAVAPKLATAPGPFGSVGVIQFAPVDQSLPTLLSWTQVRLVTTSGNVDRAVGGVVDQGGAIEARLRRERQVGEVPGGWRAVCT